MFTLTPTKTCLLKSNQGCSTRSTRRSSPIQASLAFDRQSQSSGSSQDFNREVCVFLNNRLPQCQIPTPRVDAIMAASSKDEPEGISSEELDRLSCFCDGPAPSSGEGQGILSWWSYVGFKI